MINKCLLILSFAFLAVFPGTDELLADSDDVYDAIIVGSGPAGYTAGIYLARNGLHPLLISGPDIGGQLMRTKEVENFPGFPNGIVGFDLMQAMEQQAVHHGTRLKIAEVIAVNLKQPPFEVTVLDPFDEKVGHKILKTRGLIIATGARAKQLDVPGNHIAGTSSCAVCDGALPGYLDVPLAVVGGGDTAMEDALYLGHYASKVTIIHRGEKVRASQVLQDRVKNTANIEVLYDTEVTAIHGQQKIESLSLINKKSGLKSDLKTRGLFFAIGHTPNTGYLKNSGLELDEEGYIKTKAGTTQTNIPGVFAAGDVQDRVYKQAVTAAGSGCVAAIDLSHYLNTLAPSK